MTEEEKATRLASTLASLEHLLSIHLWAETLLDDLQGQPIHPEQLTKDIQLMVLDGDVRLDLGVNSLGHADS